MFTPIRAVFVGDGSLVVRCVEAFVQAGHTVVRVASADAEVLSWAREHGLSAEAAGEVPRFEGDDFEVLFSIGWLHRLPQPLLRRASRVALNFHDGPLPRHGGLNAPAWALLEGCRHHGITWHEITEALDGGRIAGELCFDLAPDETAFSLNTHCYEAGFQSFLTLMDLLARDSLTLRAPSGSPRLHSRHQRPAALATLDWRRPAADLAGLVRALDFGPMPNPLACAKLWAEGRLMRVGSAGVEEAAPGIGVESIETIEPIEAIEPTGTPATTPIAQLATRPTRAMAPAGTVLAAQGARLWLATGQGTLRLEGLQALDGGPLPAWSLGERLAPLPPERLLRLAQARPALARGELAWRKRLLAWAGEPVADLPHPRRARMHETGEGAEASEDQPCPFEIALDLPAQADAEAPQAWLAGVAAWLAAVSGEAQVVLAWRDDTLARACEGLAPHVACWWPVGLAVHRDLTADALRLSAQQALASARSDGPITADLWLRLGRPAPAAPALGLCLAPWPEGAGFDAPGLCLLGPGHGHRPEHLQTGLRDDACADEPGPVPWRLRVDGRLWSPEVAAEIAAQLGAWLARFARHAGPIARLSLLPPTDIARLAQMNDSARALPAHPGLWPALSRALQARPASIALEWEGGRLTAAELRGRALGLSAQLRASGMAPGEVVGICLPRGPSLLVAVLAVLAAGGAYLPLDPEYPAERLRFMCRDAGLRRVLGEPAAAALLELPDEALVSPEAAAPVVSSKLPDASPDAPPAEASRGPGDLAYLIYTSGSTGQPKGVEVTQGNVLNFFAGMDAVLALPADARWLAVTSLSFDISVLELLWTLARGVTVVLHGAQAQPLPAAPEPRQVVPATPTPTDSTPPTIPTIPTTQVPPAAPQFSLFYFASEDSAAPPALAERGSDALTQGEGRARGEDPYRLLLEGARFADRHGFAAVWTPERHFHGFGGPFPNPALAAAALAMVTERVQLRAGSCVLPLHHPLAVAEDWALVDRLSGGRVGVSFAAGWQPQDFALAPEAWTDRRARLLEGIAAVRRLWRGEALAWPGPEGEELRLRTRPRPVQAELPVWVTAAGNPQTFAEAGRAGCHLLTHLLGQSVDELARKLQVYRGAWQAAGHPGQGQVTLMLHTLVGEDEDAQREAARAPLKAYLRSAMDLIRRADWRFPTFGQADLAQAPPTEAETEALLEHAYARYAQTSALIGAPARCLDLVLHLARLGVDEIACLIDFGLPTEQVLAQLPALHRLMRLSQEALGAGAQAPARALSRPPGQGAARALSVAAALQRQRITHLQCTPSQVAILLADAAGRAALSQLSALLVGGEALPPAMARALRALVRGPVLNMYGPTEATVWCSCGPLPQAQADAQAGEEALVSLGRPLANTTLHLRNTWGQECPAFVPGELCIAGAGLARGYHARPALNALRFIDDPLRAGRRLYRTGDQVRRHPDGRLVFLGRLDDQVKIRGHRIELGEVEAALARQAGVQEAVVVACRDEAGQAWLQAFVTARRGSSPQPLVLARALARLLPDFMLPRSIALRESLPTTPNGKIDRRALLASRPLAADARRALAGDDRAAVPAQPLAGAERVLPRPGGPAGERALHQLEALVAEAWRSVLGRADIAREANFFDLGGHSLAVIQVQRRLREATGVDLAITDMFRLTTVAAQARHLAARRRPASLAPPGAAMTAPMPQAQPAQPPQPPQPPQVAPSTPLALGQVRAQARRALRAGVPG